MSRARSSDVPAPLQEDTELTPQQDVIEISDEEDEPETLGPIPLGTSDLDIPADAEYDDDEESMDGEDDKTVEGLPEDFGDDIAAMLRGGTLPTGECPYGFFDKRSELFIFQNLSTPHPAAVPR